MSHGDYEKQLYPKHLQNTFSCTIQNLRPLSMFRAIYISIKAITKV